MTSNIGMFEIILKPLLLVSITASMKKEIAGGRVKNKDTGIIEIDVPCSDRKREVNLIRVRADYLLV